MASFKVLIPSSSEELYTNLVKLYENKKHVSSIKLDTHDYAVKVDLDWAANNLGGTPDFQIPILSKMLSEAAEIVSQLKSDAERGQAPSRSTAERLFNCIDVSR